MNGQADCTEFKVWLKSIAYIKIITAFLNVIFSN